jgi:hypothetical protein
LLVSAVIVEVWNFQIPAVAKVSAPAQETRAVMAAVPGTSFIDGAGDFMSGNSGILNAGPRTLFDEHVTVTDTTSLHLPAPHPQR